MKETVTLRQNGSSEYTDRKSVFIGAAAPVATEDEAKEYIQRIKKQHPDARHNVFAYILRDGAVKRYSDDGEPQGSAGKPVLDVLEKNGLDGAVCVVTRYFGGILLGTGGLVRAYSSAASAACEAAGRVTLRECELITLRVSYNDHGRVANILKNSGIVPSDTAFGADVTVSFPVLSESAEAVCSAVTEATAGRAVISHDGKTMAEI